MKYTLIAVALLTTFSAFADNEGATPEMSKEQLYTALCQPGSALERGRTDGQQKELREFRARFQAFLASPEATVKQLEAKQANTELDLGEQISFVFQVAFTCGAAEQLKDFLLPKGCTRPDGRRISAFKAITLCQPLIQKMKAEQDAREKDAEEK